MKKYICFILIAVIILSALPVFGAEAGWEKASGNMRRLPVDNYYSHQNSPSFSWPYVDKATYELVVSNDKELTDIAYREDNLKVNVHTFSYTLEAGKEYYWSVRYKIGGGYSSWLPPYRFYLDEKAEPFTVSNVSEIAEKLQPHPRFFDAADMEKLKKIDYSNEAFLAFKRSVDSYVNTNSISLFTEEGIKDKDYGINVDAYSAPGRQLLATAVLWLITGEEKYKKYAIDGFAKVKAYNPEEWWDFNAAGVGVATAEFILAYHAALAYDILYNDMTESQRKDVVKFLENNIRRGWIYVCSNGEYKGSLYEEPQQSTGWRMNQVTIAALAIYEESELARKIVDFHLPIFANFANAQTYEDGASLQGHFYGVIATFVSTLSMLNKTGIANTMSKGLMKNHPLFYLYLYPSNMVGSIGDTYNSTPDTYQAKLTQLALSANGAIPEYREYAKWALKHNNAGNTNYYYASEPSFITANANGEVKTTPPYILPAAKHFPDANYIGMHSDLKDDNRVSMIFKSNWYGGYNHGHPDNNMFIISGYGEELASDSDYYDSYNSAFDVSWNRKTYAHNTITYDNGMGQPRNNTWGTEITDFIGHTDFKLASGDASTSYSSGLDRFRRDIIYIHPETFIVIDDLKSKNENKSEFEWWLNTRGTIGVYENLKGFKITKGEAAMEVRAHYPDKLIPYYIDYFAGPDLSKVTPPSASTVYDDKRVYFQTEKTNKTKIVATLDVHGKNDRVRDIKQENYNDYLKLSFEDGSICYINLTNSERIVTSDDLEFSGVAFIYNSESYMLVDGTYAKMDGKELVLSETPVSAAVGKEEISVSSINKDSVVKVSYPGKPQKLIKQDDIYFYDIEENTAAAGVRWNYADDKIELNLYPGSYILYTDKKVLAGGKDTGLLKMTIDGITTEIPFEGTYDVNGELSSDFWTDDYEGIYKLNSTKNISIRDTVVGETVLLGDDVLLYLKGKNPEISLS